MFCSLKLTLQLSHYSIWPLLFPPLLSYEICTLDMTKAFNCVNHNLFFCKLINQKVPKYFVIVSMKMFINCVIWGSFYTNYVKISCGVMKARRNFITISLCFFFDDMLKRIIKSPTASIVVNSNYIVLSNELTFLGLIKLSGIIIFEIN